MRKRRFEGLIQEQPLAEGRWEGAQEHPVCPWAAGDEAPTDISAIAPSLSFARESKSSPTSHFSSAPRLQHRTWADG